MIGKHQLIVRSRALEFNLIIERNITFIRGDSATGKTTLINNLATFKSNGKDSGIEVKLDVPFEAFPNDSPMRIEDIKYIHDSIIFIDERHAIVKSKEFAEVVINSSNYFVIITRDQLKCLPYSIKSIKKLVTIKDGEIYKILFESDIIKSSKGKIVPYEIIAEDSKSGRMFFEKVFNCRFNDITTNGNIANNNSNILPRLASTQSDNILVIVDGAAFGPYIHEVQQFIKRVDRNIVIWCPESFEYLLLRSNLLYKFVRDELEHTYDFVDSSIFASWERYFTNLLINVLHDNWGIIYSKSTTCDKLVTSTFIEAFKKIIPSCIVLN